MEDNNRCMDNSSNRSSASFLRETTVDVVHNKTVTTATDSRTPAKIATATAELLSQEKPLLMLFTTFK